MVERAREDARSQAANRQCVSARGSVARGGWSRALISRGSVVSVACAPVRQSEMASHDDVGIGDFVLLDEITVDRVVENLRTRYVVEIVAENAGENSLTRNDR